MDAIRRCRKWCLQRESNDEAGDIDPYEQLMAHEWDSG